jgi:hypothetical protein
LGAVLAGNGSALGVTVTTTVAAGVPLGVSVPELGAMVKGLGVRPSSPSQLRDWVVVLDKVRLKGAAATGVARHATNPALPKLSSLGLMLSTSDVALVVPVEVVVCVPVPPPVPTPVSVPVCELVVVAVAVPVEELVATTLIVWVAVAVSVALMVPVLVPVPLWLAVTVSVSIPVAVAVTVPVEVTVTVAV